MRACIHSLLLAFILLMAVPAQSQQQLFTANSGASEVHITLGGSAHTTHGIFHVARGTVRFNPKDKRMSGLVAVTAGSGDTGNGSRDKRMKEEVLEAPRFAEISFAPQSYEGSLQPAGDSSLQVKGIFTLHGAPHSITISMQVHMEGKMAAVRAHFIIPYVEWGLKDPSKFIFKVDKKVAVDVTLTGLISPAA